MKAFLKKVKYFIDKSLERDSVLLVLSVLIAIIVW